MITLAWAEVGGEIQVASTNASTWLFSEWQQNTGVATRNGNHRIDYNVTGTVKVYAVVKFEFIEIARQQVTISGYVNV